MNYLIFLGGAIIGCVISQLLFRYKTAYGYFKIEPYDDNPDLYKVNVCIRPDEKLLNTNKIILHKDDSQK